MSRGVGVLLGAQFLTAFADNAILFTAIAMLIEAPRGAWYVPALQAAFLVRRGKARRPSGCEPRPATVAPAGSNRSSREGDDPAEASDVKGH